MNLAALIIIGVIILIFVLLAFLKFSLVVSYRKELVLYAKVLFIKIPLAPKKKKRLKYRGMTPEKLRKAEEKELLKANKKKQKQGQKKSLMPEVKSFSDAISLVTFLKNILGEFFSRIKGKISVKIYSLRIFFGSGDVQKTALEHTAVISLIDFILAFADANTRLKIMDREKISVIPSFTDKVFEADVKIKVSIRVWQVLYTLLPPAIKVIKHFLQGNHPASSNAAKEKN